MTRSNNKQDIESLIETETAQLANTMGEPKQDQAKKTNVKLNVFEYKTWDGRYTWYMQIQKEEEEPITISIGAKNFEKLRKLTK